LEEYVKNVEMKGPAYETLLMRDRSAEFVGAMSDTVNRRIDRDGQETSNWILILVSLDFQRLRYWYIAVEVAMCYRLLRM
jgi:hypothetical protein